MEFQKIRQSLLYAGVTKEAYELVMPEMTANNRRMLMVLSLLTCGVLAILALTSTALSSIAGNQAAYDLMAMAALVLYFVAGYAPDNLVLPGCYVFMALIYALGVALGTVFSPGTPAVSVIAFLLALPLLFVDRPLRMNGVIILGAIAFVIVAVLVKVRAAWEEDIINTLSFSLVSMTASTFLMNTKVERYVFEAQMRIMSETDQLTGLKNRNCYELRMTAYPKYCAQSISCIYLDANGLHELNNTEGHAAGDAMLKFIARELQIAFGERDTYRIGGDEFVAFATDCDRDEVRYKVDTFNQRMTEQGYHISVGIETQRVPEIHMHALVQAAETSMYQHKAEYYKMVGNDRRGR